MTRMAQADRSQRPKRILWSKALLAVAPAALFIAAPAPAHADGACTALANDADVDAYKACRIKMNLHCEYAGGFYTEVHATCAYPDGGRDDCVEHLVPFSGGRSTGIACTYVPPGEP